MPLIPSGLDTQPLVSGWLSFARDGTVALRVGKVELGQGIAVALALIAADELDVDPSRVEVVPADTATSPDEGFTAGSLSVELCGHAVRVVASAARTLFCRAAEITPDRIDDGSFYRGGAPTGESYWTLAHCVDLDTEAAPLARPKPRDAYRYVGQPGIGIDLHAQLSGSAFIHDLVLPDMLHGRLIRSANPFATPGLTPKAPDVIMVRDGQFIGVLAEREEQAAVIADRLTAQMDWQPDPAASDPLARILRSNVAAALDEHRGEAGKTQRRIEVTGSREFIAHASIAPSCAIALWDDGGLTIWSHSQGVFALRASLAQLFDLDLARVRVIHGKGAGCYGHNGADDAAADAAMLARRVPGRPVRVQWTRAQELANSPAGAAMQSRIVAHLDDAGKIASMQAHIVSYSHARRPGIGGINLLAGYLRATPVDADQIVDPPLALGGGADRNSLPCYDVPYVTSEKSIVTDGGIRTSSLRSLGAHVNVPVIEAVMEDGAALAGVDSVAYRLAHLADPRARAVIEEAVRMSGWPLHKPSGIAYARYKNKGAYCAIVARIDLADEIRVRQVWCAVDVGMAVDPDGVVNQIEGGILQTISWTLKESLPLADGAPSVRGWEDYPILGFDEVPLVEVSLLDQPDQPSLGAGEATQGPMAAALCNAVAAGLGVRITKLPITRERIIEALA